jgi:hypothetical protein
MMIVEKSRELHVDMLLFKRSSLHIFYPFLVYRCYIQIVVNSKTSQGHSLITTTNQTILNVVRYAQKCTVIITVKFDNREIKMTPN